MRYLQMIALTVTLTLALFAVAGCGGRKATLVVLPVPGDHNWTNSELTVRAAADVTLTLKNTNTSGDDSFVYNWVLLDEREGEDAKNELIADVGSNASLSTTEAEHEAVLKSHPGVLTFTPTVKPGESTTITFLSPPPGDYSFICTAGGHFLTMRGILHVTK